MRQSERAALYQAALDDADRSAASRSAARARARSSSTRALGIGGERVYPGTCRDGIAVGRRAVAHGACASGEGCTHFVDRLQGASSNGSTATSATS